MTNLNDEELARAASQGDLESFNALVDRHQDQAYGIALRMLRQPQAAEDAVQDAFLNAYRGIARYRGGSFRSWLLRIVMNSCYDAIRRSRRRPSVSLEERAGEGKGEDVPWEPAEPGPGPEELAIRKEQQRVLSALLLELPPQQRAVLVLTDVQGLSYEEVSGATGEPLGTVKSRLSRARARLRDLLRSRPELFPDVTRLDQQRP